jgi:hypothetical protein
VNERFSRSAQRVRVTSPRLSPGPRPAQRPTERSAAREINEQTDVGEVYLSALLRSQLRPGLALLAAVVLGLGGLPVLFTLLPKVAAYPVGPLTLAWLLIGFAVFPVTFGAAWWYVRTVERLERDFTEILRRR